MKFLMCISVLCVAISFQSHSILYHPDDDGIGCENQHNEHACDTDKGCKV